MADIKQITIPSGNSTATYNLKDAAALHGISDFTTTTITPSTNLKAYEVQTLSDTALTSNGNVSIPTGTRMDNGTPLYVGQVTDYKLSLAGVINSFSSTGEDAATISGLTSAGQTVLTGIAAS